MSDEIEKRVKKHLVKFKRQYCQRDKGLWYPYNENRAEEYDSRNRRFVKIIKKEMHPGLLCGWAEEMSYWHALQIGFMKLCDKGDKSQQRDYLALAAYLGFLNTITSYYIPSNVAGLHAGARAMALCAICGWDKEVDRLGDNMIISINNEMTDPMNDFDEYGSSIGHGDHFVTHTHSWMIFDMYCLSTGKTYNKAHARRTENLIPYDKVLADWDTDDLTKVDQFCYQLAEAHIDIHVESDSFEAIEMWPYEVEAWFYFRTKSGA